MVSLQKRKIEEFQRRVSLIWNIGHKFLTALPVRDKIGQLAFIRPVFGSRTLRFHSNDPL
jgi:hypothetical protein